MTIEIRPEPFGSPVTQPMADAQQAELTARHHGSPGSGAMPSPEYFQPPDGTFVVAFEDGTPIACGGVGRWNDEIAELRRMYVLPEHRGRGLGRAIMERLEEEARRLGYARMRLETGNEAPEAIGLYTSSGYAPIPCWGPFATDPKSRCYEKRL